MKRFRDYAYYILIGIVSLISVCVIPLLQSEIDVGYKLPQTRAAWIVWAGTKISVAILNMIIFHCFVRQGAENAKEHPNKKKADEILQAVKAEKQSAAAAVSPKRFLGKEYGTKIPSLLLTTALSLVSFGQAILAFDFVSFLTYAFTVVTALVFGVLEMYKVEDYYTGEYLEYALFYQKKKENENMLEFNGKKYRNLEEQVAHNANVAERLEAALKGIPSKPGYITVDKPAGFLSDEQFEFLQTDVSNGVNYKGDLFSRSTDWTNATPPRLQYVNNNPKNNVLFTRVLTVVLDDQSYSIVDYTQTNDVDAKSHLYRHNLGLTSGANTARERESANLYLFDSNPEPYTGETLFLAENFEQENVDLKVLSTKATYLLSNLYIAIQDVGDSYIKTTNYLGGPCYLSLSTSIETTRAILANYGGGKQQQLLTCGKNTPLVSVAIDVVEQIY